MSSKIDVFATLGVQKCYFEVGSSALSYIKSFPSILDNDHTHILRHKIITYSEA